ncbi:hypothetical protein Tco_0077415 [Tanacetum coccineum]
MAQAIPSAEGKTHANHIEAPCGKLLEEIHVTWTQFRKKRDKIAPLHKVTFKECVQCLDTAFGFVATPSELTSDGVKTFVTASERNRLNETLEDWAKRWPQDYKATLSIRYKGKDTLGVVILGVILHKDLLTLSDPYSDATLFGDVTAVMSSSTVTYTSIYSDSEPWRFQWAPPSPDYVPGPEHPPSPDYVPGLEYPEYLVPSDDEVPVEDQPLPTDALATTLSPGYVADSDPLEEDPKEDPEEDPAEYPADGGDDDNDDDDDDDEDDDDEENEEEEEHLASADSTALPAIDPVPSAEDT